MKINLFIPLPLIRHFYCVNKVNKLTQQEKGSQGKKVMSH